MKNKYCDNIYVLVHFLIWFLIHILGNLSVKCDTPTPVTMVFWWKSWLPWRTFGEEIYQEPFVSHSKTKDSVDQSFACYALTKAVKLTVKNCSNKSNPPLWHFIHTGTDLTLFTCPCPRRDVSGDFPLPFWPGNMLYGNRRKSFAKANCTYFVFIR